MIPETENPKEANSVCPGMLRQIWVDRLRRVRNVGFFVERVKYMYNYAHACCNKNQNRKNIIFTLTIISFCSKSALIRIILKYTASGE